MSIPETIDLSEQMRDRRDKEPLLDRVRKIGTPLAAALADSRSAADADGDEPQPDIDRETVALAMRRLLTLCEDIEEGIYSGEDPQDGESSS